MAVENLDQRAEAVIRGDYGNGIDRENALGDDYYVIQNRVNEMLGNDFRYDIPVEVSNEPVVESSDASIAENITSTPMVANEDYNTAIRDATDGEFSKPELQLMTTINESGSTTEIVPPTTDNEAIHAKLSLMSMVSSYLSNNSDLSKDQLDQVNQWYKNLSNGLDSSIIQNKLNATDINSRMDAVLSDSKILPDLKEQGFTVPSVDLDGVDREAARLDVSDSEVERKSDGSEWKYYQEDSENTLDEEKSFSNYAGSEAETPTDIEQPRHSVPQVLNDTGPKCYVNDGRNSVKEDALDPTANASSRSYASIMGDMSDSRKRFLEDHFSRAGLDDADKLKFARILDGDKTESFIDLDDPASLTLKFDPKSKDIYNIFYAISTAKGAQTGRVMSSLNSTFSNGKYTDMEKLRYMELLHSGNFTVLDKFNSDILAEKRESVPEPMDLSKRYIDSSPRVASDPSLDNGQTVSMAPRVVGPKILSPEDVVLPEVKDLSETQRMSAMILSDEYRDLYAEHGKLVEPEGEKILSPVEEGMLTFRGLLPHSKNMEMSFDDSGIDKAGELAMKYGLPEQAKKYGFDVDAYIAEKNTEAEKESKLDTSGLDSSLRREGLDAGSRKYSQRSYDDNQLQ